MPLLQNHQYPLQQHLYHPPLNLNLDQKQIKAFGTWGKSYRDETKEILIEMSKTRVALFNEMSSADPDTAKMFAMADEIGSMQEMML